MKSSSKRIITIVLIFIFCFTESTYATNKPDIGGESYIVIDAKSGRILSEKNSNDKEYMASTTKIMTAILAIELTDDLDAKFKVPAKCTNVEGSSIYLVPNQEVTMRELLYGVMLRSGNDASLAVAYQAGGKSIEKFVELMNEKAKELGAYNTNFVNPNGLHNDNHYTTAYDLALISQYAMQNDVFREIVSTKSYKAKIMNSLFINKNKVVYQYSNGNGIKIGYTKKAGRCLVASAKKDDVEIIIVTLNNNNWFNDCYKMFDWAFENYKGYKLIEKNQYICKDNNGKFILSDSSFSCILSQDELDGIKLKYKKSIPHIVNGSDDVIAGYYSILLDDNIIFTGRLKYAD